jgi:hypothetical protein
MKSSLFLLFAAAPLAAQGPAVTIPRIEAAIAVDGVLDEPAWQQATRLDGFRQYQPVDSRPAEDSTVVLVWYAPDAIHIGIRAYDRDPAGVRASLADRDNIGSDDQVTIFLDTFNDQRRAYFFGVNPLGVQDDGVRAEGGFTSSTGSGITDRNPDFLWESHGMRTDFGWIAEIRIPFKTLRWSGAGEQTWGFNVQRLTQRTGYTDTWTDVRRASASFLAQAGSLTGIHDIRRGVVTEIQPTFVAQQPGAQSIEGAFERGDLDAEFGGNLRLGFTSLTIDATFNPDFSQVESDVGLVTINERFALFFPERRPFFLEGIDLFAAPNNLVYTRTVANPLAGAKITGKFGRWSLAHLSALDEYSQSGAGEDVDAMVHITRLRRDVGDNSVAGLTLTSRDEAGAFNRVVSADTRLVFGKLYYFQAQAAASFTAATDGAETVVDPLWQVEVDRTGRGWGFNYRLTGIGDDFRTWSGFVNRTGIVTGGAFNRFSVYGKPGALMEQFTVFGGLNQIWQYDQLFGARPLEGDFQANGSLRLRGGWQIGFSPRIGFVRFDQDDYAGYQVAAESGSEAFLPASGVFDATTAQFSVRSPNWQYWDASVEVRTGTTAIFPEAARGRATSVSGSVSLRPSSAFRVSGSMTLQRLWRDSDDSEFARTVLPRVKVEVQPSRALFFRVIAEYRSERQAALQDAVSGLPLLIGGSPVAARRTNRLRTDWLASFEPTAGTVAFIGYGATMQSPRELSFDDLSRSEDAFFLKLAYLFRK